MSERIGTKSALIELREERRSMREGFAFLDEKCLLLAGAMMRELITYETLWHEYQQCHQHAQAALGAALGRHGLEGLTIYPLTAADPDDPAQRGAALQLKRRSIMGVPLLDAHLDPHPPTVSDPLLRSPEAAACGLAYAQLLRCAARLAAATDNLQRLQQDYRRTSRRARSLDGVLLPEYDRNIDEMTVNLEEQEREDAIFMRPRQRRSSGAA